MFWDNFNLSESKAKAQQIERVDNYYKMGLATLLEMFEYNNIDDFDYRFFIQIELYKMIFGCAYVTISPKTGELTVYHGNLGGEPDVYGQGKNFVGTTENGEAINEPWTNGCLFRNNKIMSSEVDNLYRFAVALANNDVSLNALVKYSKVTPFAFVKDSKMLKAINKFLENSLIGKPLFLQMSDRISFATEVTNTAALEKIDLMDPTLCEKIQYISQFSDDLKRRFYTFYGHSQAGAHKMAQQSIDEISADDTISMIYPNQRLSVLKKDLEIFNEKFGYNVEADFSISWMAKQDDIMDSILDEPENLPDQDAEDGEDNED